VLCSRKDGRSTQLAGPPPGAGTAGRPAHWHHQSDSRFPVGARRRRAAGITVLARRVTHHLATLFRRPYLAEIFVSVGQLIAAKAGPYERLEPPASTMTVALCLGEGWADR